MRFYFGVDTAYVRRKLGLLFFPYIHKDFERDVKDGKVRPPREDLNSPDLYLPRTPPVARACRSLPRGSVVWSARLAGRLAKRLASCTDWRRSPADTKHKPARAHTHTPPFVRIAHCNPASQ